MSKKRTKFMCQACGYESARWMGRCPGCSEWNKMVEEVEIVGKQRKGSFQHSEPGIQSKAVPITAIERKNEPRVTTKMQELNRVLGGGVVPGSLILIGGDPGIGKSTLLLQVSSQLADCRSKGFIYFR